MAASDGVHDEWVERFREFRDRPAFVERKRCVTYGGFLERIAAWDARLTSDGVRRGDSVAFSGVASAETLALAFALAKRRCLAAPLGGLAPETAGPRLDLTAASATYAIDGDSAVLTRRPPPTLEGRPIVHPLIETLRGDREAGLTLFTSGAPSVGKAVLQSFDRWLTRFRVPGEPTRTLAFFPLDHYFGLDSALRTLAAGGTLVTLEERTPIGASRAIERDRVETLPTTPTFLNAFVKSGAIGLYDFAALETIQYGAEPMPPATLAAVRAALPATRLEPVYGLAELGGLPTLARDDDSLWWRIGGAEVETTVRDGSLWVRSRNAPLGYLDAEPAVDDAGWLDTGDAVEVAGEFVRVLGPRGTLVAVGGDRFAPTDVESVLLEMPEVRDAVVYGRKHPVMGTIAAATVSLVRREPAAAFEKRMRERAVARLPETRVPLMVETTDAPLHTDRFKKRRSRAVWS